MKILVTGAAGFIGFHTIRKLITSGHDITGLDVINSYYSPELKTARLAQLGISITPDDFNTVIKSNTYSGLQFTRTALEDWDFIAQLFHNQKFDAVIHLAAQAGVRHSLENPRAYVMSNLVGFFNILEGCRLNNVPHLVYASSSSVYGNEQIVPFREDQISYKPVSLYAATKQGNEHMAYAYSHIYKFRTTGLRFFTVYGPWGRPDMAYYLFADKILKGETITVYNHGEQFRDFTYIDDVTAVFPAILSKSDWNDIGDVPSNVYNIGNNSPVHLMEFIREIENALGKKAFMEMAPGLSVDVERTYADVNKARSAFGFSPSTDISSGIDNFVDWLKSYHH